MTNSNYLDILAHRLNTNYIDSSVCNISLSNIGNYKFLHAVRGNNSKVVPWVISRNSDTQKLEYTFINNLVSDRRITIYKKNYKKLYQYYFFSSSSVVKYTLDSTYYYLGKGIIMDENLKILALLVRNRYDSLSSSNSLYINSSLLQSPQNNFEKAIINNIYKPLLGFSSSGKYIEEVIISSDINSKFIAENNIQLYQETLHTYLAPIANNIDSIIDNIIGDEC